MGNILEIVERAVCPQDVILESQTVTTTETFTSCADIRSGNGFIVGAGGDVTFEAAGMIALSALLVPVVRLRLRQPRRSSGGWYAPGSNRLEVQRMTAIALPPDLQDELTALTETGMYASEEAVLTDALRTLFAARPELRLATACRLYDKGAFSLGRASEWSGVSLERLKEELHERGIQRRTEGESTAVESMARRAATLAGGPEPGW